MRFLFQDFTLPYLLRDDDYPVGGWAVALNAWLRALKETGHQAGVLTWRGAVDYVVSQDVCELLDTYDPSKGIRIFKYGYSYIPSLVNASRRFAPDAIIQSCAGLETGMLAFVARRLGVPFFHMVASDVDADDRFRSVLSWPAQVGFKYGLARADAIICQNSYQMDALRARYPKSSLTIIRTPFDGKLRHARTRRERSYIAWLGVFRQPKDLPRLLRIAQALPSVMFRVGGTPALSLDVETAAALQGLRLLPNVDFVGYVKRSEVHRFLSEAIAVLCTSFFEGFSNVFLEAFAAGTPVLARRSVDPDLVITRHRLGLTVENPATLVDAVTEICAMDDRCYMEATQRCQRYMEQNHAAPKCVLELVGAIAPHTKSAGQVCR